VSIGIGRAIAARRAILGLSRTDLAREASLSYPFLANIETGDREPSIGRLRDIAAVLGWSMSDLFAVADAEVGDWPAALTTR
jgi:transcriptional regulator with XRE-family HTH domain